MKKIIAGIIAASLLASCGGGGGGSSAPGNTQAFPLASISHNLIANGEDVSFHGVVSSAGKSGTVTGNDVESLPTGFTTGILFEGQAAQSTRSTGSLVLTVNGASQTISSDTFNYYDKDLVPLGMVGSDYYEVADSVPGYPASAVIGAQGGSASFSIYSDSSKSTKLGTAQETWKLMADGSSANSALLVVTSTETDTSGASSISQSTLRISSTGGYARIGETLTSTDPASGTLTIDVTFP